MVESGGEEPGNAPESAATGAVLVTGAAARIGRAIALDLGRRGLGGRRPLPSLGPRPPPRWPRISAPTAAPA